MVQTGRCVRSAVSRTRTDRSRPTTNFFKTGKKQKQSADVNRSANSSALCRPTGDVNPPGRIDRSICSVKLAPLACRALGHFKIAAALATWRCLVRARGGGGCPGWSRAEHTSVAFVSVSAADRAPHGSPRRKRSLSLSVIKLSIRDI